MQSLPQSTHDALTRSAWQEHRAAQLQHTTCNGVDSFSSVIHFEPCHWYVLRSLFSTISKKRYAGNASAITSEQAIVSRDYHICVNSGLQYIGMRTLIPQAPAVYCGLSQQHAPLKRLSGAFGSWGVGRGRRMREKFSNEWLPMPFSFDQYCISWYRETLCLKSCSHMQPHR